jgi:hypothetical protein
LFFSKKKLVLFPLILTRARAGTEAHVLYVRILRYCSPLFCRYASQNGGDFKFMEGYSSQVKEIISIPLEEKFWHFLIGNAKLWGLINYQQDWM